MRFARARARVATLLVLSAALMAAACGSEDVGSDQTDTAGTSGVGSRAAGGATGIDTAGGRLNTDRTGSVVAPGPGQTSGAPGATTADSVGAKTKATRP